MEYMVRKNINATKEEYLNMPNSKVLHIIGFAVGTNEREEDMNKQNMGTNQKSYTMPKMPSQPVQHYPVG